MSENVVIDRARYAALARHSHDVIARFQHANGAYPASPTFSAYRGYSWLRDGGFIAEGMSRYGDVASATAFHDWVDGELAARRAQVDELIARDLRGEPIEPAHMLPTRFAMEPDAPADDWWNFQTDGYGTWLWAVIVHADRHGLDLQRWRRGIAVAADYAIAFWDRPCYDWWEENVNQRHGSTLAALYGGLMAIATASGLARELRERAGDTAVRIRELLVSDGLAPGEGYLTKWIGSRETDASLASAIVPFGVLDPLSPPARATMARIASDLDVDGGVHRYRADEFYGGGQWPLLSCLVGWNEAVAGDTAQAWRHLTWAASQFTPEGELAEQLPHHLLNPQHRQHWIDTWGPVATPLLWSHGMYLILADELGVKTAPPDRR